MLSHHPCLRVSVQASPCCMSSPLPSHSSGTHWRTRRRTCTARRWRTWRRSWQCLWRSTWASERWTQTATVRAGPAINDEVRKRRAWWNDVNWNLNFTKDVYLLGSPRVHVDNESDRAEQSMWSGWLKLITNTHAGEHHTWEAAGKCVCDSKLMFLFCSCERKKSLISLIDDLPC